MFGLSKLADKNFVIGFLLPVLIVFVAAAGLFHDTEAVGFIYVAILQEKSFTSLTIIVLAIWSAAVLLMVWNHAVSQALEGYIGPFNRESWRASMRNEFLRERDVLRKMSRDEPDYIRKFIRFRRTYPYDADYILPTRFGNLIRSFETYSLNVYGVDAIPAWHRLSAVIPKDFAGKLDDARAEVNFWVNLWVMALLFMALAAARFVWDVYPHIIRGIFKSVTMHGLMQIHWEFAALSFLAIGIAFFAYSFAIDRALEWGDLIKSAFDLYLPSLAKTLGYNLPPTKDKQIAFWEAVNGMFLLQIPLRPECWPSAGELNAPSQAPEPKDSEASESDCRTEDRTVENKDSGEDEVTLP